MSQTDGLSDVAGPRLNKGRHIKYWLRCLKTFLPTNYTSNDSQRMMFACFTLSSLDLLSALDDHVTVEEKASYTDWIYRCQHPDGGFKGFTGADAGDNTTEKGRCWDPANIAATFFALSALMILGDDMQRVRKAQCLEWVRRLQKSDGSFGEAIGKNGAVEGGGDVRWCHLATAIRIVMRRGNVQDANDIDVAALEKYVRNSITYEGGIARAPFHEAHAGWTYCGVGVLKMLGKLDQRLDKGFGLSSKGHDDDDSVVQDLLHWLVDRQTSFLLKQEDEVTEEADMIGFTPNETAPTFVEDAADPPMSTKPAGVDGSWVAFPVDILGCAGFNGRCNKVADTCYAFWAGASLAMLHVIHLQDFNAIRRYLLDRTQHAIGGFGKVVGDPPDILHSYLGLAALSCLRDSDLRSIDPVLCISVRAREEFEAKY